MHLYQSASNTKVNVDKTTVIKCGSPRFQPPTGYYHSPPGEVFWHLGILFTDKGIALREMKSKLLSNLVNKMSKWKYKLLDLESKLWYAAHIVPFTKTFEKKVDTITRTFIWGSLQQAPIGLQHLYSPKKSGSLGLQQVAVKAKHMWAKEFLDFIKVYFRSPALGRAFNMVVSVLDEPFNTNFLRIIIVHPSGKKREGLYNKGNGLSMRAISPGTTKQNSKPLTSFSVTQKNLEKGGVSIEIMKTKYPAFIKGIETNTDTFPEARKCPPDPNTQDCL
ncbi:hypothetical protein DSO57_1006347 [Entomophthora muscae]|uniref:Uncharacterized protein n=1 Tax=Entomophthora muscae TaxID=34485 RepID=A0ACC2U602_9FUNG|nr:hypothetical protein DSO57_1006347 [Entomophthora muscae]